MSRLCTSGTWAFTATSMRSHVVFTEGTLDADKNVAAYVAQLLWSAKLLAPVVQPR